MGPCISLLTGSRANLIKAADGCENDYASSYVEERTLGQGQFGIVKLALDKTRKEYRAVKILAKGFTYKDNTLYTPIKQEVLRLECDILRALGGGHFNLRLFEVYESGSKIWMVLECCAGGEMTQWVSHSTELRTETVSRIAFQLLDAVRHCHENGVIHRDIKPENVMFVSDKEDSQLRLIDYGSGCMDLDRPLVKKDDPTVHQTYAGSAFYISPELFQRAYTAKTDIWSVGATLYVLVAGYPGEKLQAAFNIMHTSKKQSRKLRNLPGMPSGLPDSFYEMMNMLLKYKHKHRMNAEDTMRCEFVQFHRHYFEDSKLSQAMDEGISFDDIAKEAAGFTPFLDTTRPFNNKGFRTESKVIEGSVYKHTMYLGYQNFERSITTLLATMLNATEYQSIIDILENEIKQNYASCQGPISTEEYENNKKLKIVKIQKLLEVLNNIGKQEIVFTIENLQNTDKYKTFSYHVELLRLFTNESTSGAKQDTAQNQNTADALKLSSRSNGRRPSNSVHGNNVWNEWKRKSERTNLISSRLSSSDLVHLSVPA